MRKELTYVAFKLGTVLEAAELAIGAIAEEASREARKKRGDGPGAVREARRQFVEQADGEPLLELTAEAEGPIPDAAAKALRQQRAEQLRKKQKHAKREQKKAEDAAASMELGGDGDEAKEKTAETEAGAKEATGEAGGEEEGAKKKKKGKKAKAKEEAKKREAAEKAAEKAAAEAEAAEAEVEEARLKDQAEEGKEMGEEEVEALLAAEAKDAMRKALVPMTKAEEEAMAAEEERLANMTIVEVWRAELEAEEQWRRDKVAALEAFDAKKAGKKHAKKTKEQIAKEKEKAFKKKLKAEHRKKKTHVHHGHRAVKEVDITKGNGGQEYLMESDKWALKLEVLPSAFLVLLLTRDLLPTRFLLNSLRVVVCQSNQPPGARHARQGDA